MKHWNHVILEANCMKGMLGTGKKECHRKYKNLNHRCIGCVNFMYSGCFEEDHIILNNAWLSKTIRWLCKARHWWLTKRGYSMSVIEEEKELVKKEKEEASKEFGFVPPGKKMSGQWRLKK